MVSSINTYTPRLTSVARPVSLAHTLDSTPHDDWTPSRGLRGAVAGAAKGAVWGIAADIMCIGLPALLAYSAGGWAGVAILHAIPTVIGGMIGFSQPDKVLNA